MYSKVLKNKYAKLEDFQIKNIVCRYVNKLHEETSEKSIKNIYAVMEILKRECAERGINYEALICKF